MKAHFSKEPGKHVKNLLEEIQKSRAFRQKLTYENHLWFFRMYLNHYIEYPMAWFHEDLFALTQNPTWQLAAIMAFRESGKSTIMNTSLALWAVLGKLQKKFVVVVSQNKAQAWQHLENIRQELVGNKLLINDHGPFFDSGKEHRSRFMVLPKYGAKIQLATAHQSLRGFRYGRNRPDLFIIDDIEDSLVIDHGNIRERTYEWFTREVMASVSSKTHVVVLGNLLHEKSLLMLLRQAIYERSINGIFRAYPIVDDKDLILWPGKFPTPKHIDNLERSIADNDVWQREFLLALKSQIVLKVPKSHIEKWGIGKDVDEVIDWTKRMPEPKIGRQRSDYTISAPFTKEYCRLIIVPEYYGRKKQ